MILKSNVQDNRFFSAELATALNDINAAVILQQLHYWLQKDVGVIIEGVPYVYNTFVKWVQTQFQWLSTWKFRQSMQLLRDLQIVKVIRYKAKQWNQTNYYTIDYDRLSEFAREKIPESIEIIEMCVSASQDVKSQSLEMMKASNSYKGTENTSKTTSETKQPVVASFSLAKEKCDFSQVEDRSGNFGSPIQIDGLNHDLNKVTEVDYKVDSVKDNLSRPVEVKINNKKWRSHLEQLDDLGIRENQTIRNAVRSHSIKQVEGAIALYRQKKIEAGYVGNPAGYFMQALKEDWGNKNQKLPQDQSPGADDQTAFFGCWYELARELGYCTNWEMRENDCGSSSVSDRWVLLSGQWEKWKDAWERGYNLQYLRNKIKR